MNIGFSTNYTRKNQADVNFKQIKIQTGKSQYFEYRDFVEKNIMPFFEKETVKALEAHGNIVISKNNNARNLLNLWFQIGDTKFRTYPVRKTIRTDAPNEAVYQRINEFVSETKDLFLG